MASKQTIHDKNGNDVYPITLANAIFTKDGEILNDLVKVKKSELEDKYKKMNSYINGLRRLVDIMSTVN